MGGSPVSACQSVMAGFDPAIHFSSNEMDAWIKSAHDGE
jgi:hypothetical protein